MLASDHFPLNHATLTGMEQGDDRLFFLTTGNSNCPWSRPSSPCTLSPASRRLSSNQMAVPATKTVAALLATSSLVLVVPAIIISPTADFWKLLCSCLYELPIGTVVALIEGTSGAMLLC